MKNSSIKMICSRSRSTSVISIVLLLRWLGWGAILYKRPCNNGEQCWIELSTRVNEPAEHQWSFLLSKAAASSIQWNWGNPQLTTATGQKVFSKNSLLTLMKTNQTSTQLRGSYFCSLVHTLLHFSLVQLFIASRIYIVSMMEKLWMVKNEQIIEKTL